MMYLESATGAVDDLLAHAFEDEASFEHYLGRAKRLVRKARVIVDRRSDGEVSEGLADDVNRRLADGLE
ncbi:MAG TPA: hypothetical protein VNF68_05720 [Candidatus Baltobacteraceae bacterium]|nr:hypothetical protein [Candidatus Baltobacteraceae bacterium]